ncbi:UrcA family protein [Sphingobium sp. YR768]|jgi:UrcA family protein|uniref:UrcA family protein n=1 Tax=Sphingobium sp. YR768 TaxID=1884365 RepID=UPI0008C228FA|nr:UrcA family protein [Sphingobium sp. YR768]SES02679.1 UrcA family protein [Sphingobium sp. YR768]
MFTSTKFAAVLMSATLLASAGAASAQEFQSNGRTSAVYHGDLDLSQTDQQAQLRKRIVRAANRVCASNDLSAQMACRAKAIAHVEPRMSAAIARADSKERYADAGATKEVRPVVGN